MLTTTEKETVKQALIDFVIRVAKGANNVHQAEMAVLPAVVAELVRL